MAENYEYDVAFSFLTRDDSLAQHFSDLLQERLKTFVYFEHQLELAGTDGVETLTKAFRNQARIVVILHRSDWGKSKWTQVEETAIKNRGFDEGYDFCLLIPLEKGITPPQWFPATRIWIGLDPWGIEAAAAAIEQRVRERGGVEREETLADRAARIERQTLAIERRSLFLDSDSGRTASVEQARILLKLIEQQAAALSTQNIPLTSKPDQLEVTVLSHGFSLNLSYFYGEPGSELRRVIILRLGERDRRDRFAPYHLITEEIFRFGMDECDRQGWQSTSHDSKYYLTNQLAEYSLQTLLERIAKYRQDRANRIS